MDNSSGPKPSIFFKLLNIFAVLFFLYLFLVSITLMGDAFKGFGKGFAETLIRTTSNPFVGLFIGILATSIIQSSSTTTSMVVGMVAVGTLSIRGAIPIIMGANMGTTVTNTIVSLGHITRKEEFRRAFAGATIHDFFNVLTIIVLLPIELLFHPLEKLAGVMAVGFNNFAGAKVTSPIKIIVKPVVQLVEYVLTKLSLSDRLDLIIMLILAFVVLFVSLFMLTKIMKSMIAQRLEIVFNNILGRAGIIGIFMGLIFTAIVQSSSITTSILVPLVGAGIITVEQAFPVTLGANVGTTVTAILASLTGNVYGITIAFVHLLFNVAGILIIYPIKAIRAIPINLAKNLAKRSAESKKQAIIYVLTRFYLIPALMIFVYKMWQKFFK